MIIRIFTSKCKVHEMEKFFLEQALPQLEQQLGCLYAFTGRNVEKQEVTVITIWKSLEDLKNFTGTNWKEPKVVPEEEPLLIGKPRVSHYELVGKVIKPVLKNYGNT